jgi:type IV pilus assembly protein PilC
VLIAAGLTIHQGLEQLKHSPPARSMRPLLGAWLNHLEQGHTVTESVLRLGGLASFDTALIEAGERSGRLDACFKLLALYYNERAKMFKQVISDLMYPLFIVHLAAVIFPFITLVRTGNWVRFLLTIAAILIPLYVLVCAMVLAAQGRHGEQWRGMIERILRPVPLLGTARRQLALARLAASLEALINAGVPIIGAWDLAATASGSPAIRRVVETWKMPLEQGSTPSELLSKSREFPDIFSNLYHTGEVSGQLDQTLGRLHTLYQEEGLRKMHIVAQWTPRLIYFGILLIVAWRIISFYMGYFSQLNDIMNMK